MKILFRHDMNAGRGSASWTAWFEGDDYHISRGFSAEGAICNLIRTHGSSHDIELQELFHQSIVGAPRELYLG